MEAVATHTPDDGRAVHILEGEGGRERVLQVL